MMNQIMADLPLAVVGCDFRVASSRFRSRLVLSDLEAREIAAALARQGADGFVDLNTCNRNEWIVTSEDPRWSAELLKAQMVQRVGPEAADWIQPYVYVGEEAVRHIFRVAIGQESLVVGERQIAGQLYEALEAARSRGTSSRMLNGLGSVAGRLVRVALRRGCIGNAAVGVHSLAIAYLMQGLRPGQKSKVALVGLGRIGRRVLGPLQEDPNILPVCINRTLPEDNREGILPIDRLAQVLDEVDAAVICTGAMTPIIGLDQLAARPEDRPLLLVDIGIPEQVARSAPPPNVTLAGLDELTDFYRCGCHEATVTDPDQVEALLQKALAEYRVFCNEPAFSAILDTVQRHHTQLVREEIPQLIRDRLGYLAEEVQVQLEQDIRNIVLEYTSEVFRTIKETSMRYGEDSCQEER